LQPCSRASATLSSRSTTTGYGQERDKHHAQQAGFDHHLTKPVDENVLESLINEALSG
jgi:CheY-like chemotaxis protein